MKSAEQHNYSSNGNLIISGEYFVLAGAKALVVPLRYGQQMNVRWYEDTDNLIRWNVYELGRSWFNAIFTCENLEIKRSSDIKTAIRLQQIFRVISKMKHGSFTGNRSYHFSCNIQFGVDWGWGSSSSLLCNLARWAGIDPYELNSLVSPGSGYDIAASGSPSPVFYQIRENTSLTIPVNFAPAFRNHIHFIYSGRKQNTATSIKTNLESIVKNQQEIPVISGLTDKIAREENIHEFLRLIAEHETIISKIVNLPRIKELYFNDFEGEVKSLGAWGGDFFMAVSELDETRVKHYFMKKGLVPVFSFDEIVKNQIPA